MPNRYKPNCATCTMAKKDVRLRRRIRFAAYKRETGDETLQDIANEIGVGQQSIYNHVKKHMEDISDRYKNRNELQTAKRVAEVSVRVLREAETVISKDQYDSVEARPVEILGLDDYIAQGIEDVRKGSMKMTAQTWLAAIKIKTEWSAKQQSNKTEFMKAIYAMASGDKQKVIKKESGDEPSTNTGEDAGSDNKGEKESQVFYGAITGPDTP